MISTTSKQRQKNRDTFNEIQTYFSIHAHLVADSFYYLRQHWDDDVGFSITPDRGVLVNRVQSSTSIKLLVTETERKVVPSQPSLLQLLILA